ncbi:MAG: arylsulfatase, partial [Pyrinomonadaceae bacterium]|nr:arylsulfatase [Pyrinomonadaceae bacterium]
MATSRRTFLKDATRTWLAAGLTAPAINRAPQKKRPHIILIMADDMGFSDIGCYGSEIATPNLDRLSKEGLRFTQFYNAARCCPSRAALITGLYQHQAGIGHMDDNLHVPAYQGDLNNRCVTIAEALQAGGYQTAMTGKWHLTPPTESKHNWPIQRGFQRFFGSLRGGDYYNPPFLIRGNTPIEALEGFYYTDEISRTAAEFVREMGRARQQPFFLYVAFNAPHWPLHALYADVAKYQGKYLKGWDSVREARYRRLIELGIITKHCPLSPRDQRVTAWTDVPEKEKATWDLRMAVYAAQVDRMDQGIGHILHALKESKAEENTLVMFLSDNGASDEVVERSKPGTVIGQKGSFASAGLPWGNVSNTPFRRYKAQMHEGGSATPFVVHWPAGIKHGRLIDQPGHIMDIMPTCLDAASVPYPRSYKSQKILPLEGKSLLPIFQGKARREHEALFWEHEGNRAVRQGKWKLVSRFRNKWELHDLAAGRTELN